MKITVIESGKKIFIPIPNALIFSPVTRLIVQNALKNTNEKKQDLDELDFDELEEEYERSLVDSKADNQVSIDPKLVDKLLKELQRYRRKNGSFVLVEVQSSDGAYVEIVV